MRYANRPQDMNYNGLPTDLKDFKADDDGFQLVSPDLAIFLLILGVVIGYVLGVFRG